MGNAILSLLSSILGTLVGVGGGFVIRPVLGFWGVEKSLASFTSSMCVLGMAVVSLSIYAWRNWRASVAIQGEVDSKKPLFYPAMVLLAASSIPGGFVGGILMGLASEKVVNSCYMVVLAVLIILLIFLERVPKREVENRFAQICIGFILGVLSGFFGIGGGPFKMVALLIFFNLKEKDAAIQSIFITGLTTISSLISYTLNGHADFSLAVYMVPAAMLGGFIGSQITRRINHKAVSKLLMSTLFLMLALTVYKIIL